MRWYVVRSMRNNEAVVLDWWGVRTLVLVSFCVTCEKRNRKQINPRHDNGEACFYLLGVTRKYCNMVVAGIEPVYAA